MHETFPLSRGGRHNTSTEIDIIVTKKKGSHTGPHDHKAATLLFAKAIGS